ncbi:MAG: hybrid sensor histidine kinase/response regulator [Verrucomicrobia bacterium]|nr:hybrid sensor histidine kinase/response regulator [Verrucomicrobiota bacterium]MCH8528720.1 hybrid sensor histidine kinase/response regulator [Kiritimatiellia bacterium]
MNTMNPENTPAVIMVVDDTPANLKLLDEILRGQGYQTVQFPRGSMALRAAARNPPDLILLDIMMPEMDGFEVCRRLKEDGDLKEIPVLFISALDGTDDKIKAFSAGGVDYVTKPFQDAEVLARVGTHLELRRRQVRIETQKRQLQKDHDRLLELEELRDNLTNMIVHDMRSPLMGISGAYELVLMEKDRLSPMQKESVAIGQSSCRELIEMVSSLLDISRLEAGKMPLKPEPCDVREVAEASVESMAVLAREKALNLRITGESSRVSADRDILHRVFTNLISNAIKFSPRGGSISVSVTSSNPRTRVAVTDQGGGIPNKFHQRIFEKFGQEESRKEGHKHSTGLGLTFCKLAVEAHGGRIGIESDLGNGSTFWFDLPSLIPEQTGSPN